MVPQAKLSERKTIVYEAFKLCFEVELPKFLNYRYVFVFMNQ